MTDDQLVAACRQRPGEAAWERFGERCGCHIAAIAVVAWVAYRERSTPWHGWIGFVCLYAFAALFLHIFLFLLPAGIRVIPYARELERRHKPLPFHREVRRVRRAFEEAEAPDWIILVQSESGEFGWVWTQLTLFESPPRGTRERRRGPSFGVIANSQYNPLNALTRQVIALAPEDCRLMLEDLRSIDLKKVVHCETAAFDVPPQWLAVLRRNPRSTRKVRITHLSILPYAEYREHPTYRLAEMACDQSPDGRLILLDEVDRVSDPR